MTSNFIYWTIFLYLITLFTGVGIPYLLLVVVGIGWTIMHLRSGRIVLLFLTPLIFFFQDLSIFRYPLLAFYAALGMIYLIDYRIRIKGKYISYPKIFSYIFISISVVILILSPQFKF